MNPHDVMWFPIDQPGYDERHPGRGAARPQGARVGEVEGRRRPAGLRHRRTTRCATTLPPNFGDDLLDKPAAQRQWRWDQQHGLWGYIDPSDTKSWLRHLDYYVKLQRMADESLGTVLGALEESGAYDDTIVIFTSDHGDMCGSHGLRSKGPFVYEEIMHVPCYVQGARASRRRVRSRTRSRRTSTSRRRSARSAVSTRRTQPSLKGVDLGPVLADPSASVRDHVLFAHDTAHTDEINHTRYAIRGFFDGQTKYARYYGVGGGKPGTGLWGKDPGHKLFDVDADFVDQEHEWYDLDDDPHELVNLALDGGRRADLHAELRAAARVRARRVRARESSALRRS